VGWEFSSFYEAVGIVQKTLWLCMLILAKLAAKCSKLVQFISKDSRYAQVAALNRVLAGEAGCVKSIAGSF
jgi:hypothetical protein